MSKDLMGKVHYRSFWLLVLILAILLGITSLFAIYTTRYVAESMEENLTVTLASNAKSKAENLNLWVNSVVTSSRRFVDKDMIRLFCAEAILQAKAQSGDAEAQSQLGVIAPSNVDDLKNIRSIITQQLSAFVAESDFTAAGIWNAQKQPLLHTEGFGNKISSEHEYLIDATLLAKRATFSPVEDSPAGLALTMSYPIFPPNYTELPGDVPVAVLIVEIPIEIPFGRMLRGLAGSQLAYAPYRIFQWDVNTGENLQYLDLSTGTLVPYVGWDAPVSQDMPLMKRQLPDGEFVYSIGIALLGQNFMVTHEEPAYIAEDFYSNFRNFMIIFVAGAIVVTGILLWGCWWFLVGRHERKVEEDMRKLSEDVSTQQQIIDSINATLTDGVVLTDTLGNIRYSNPSFAKMVYHDTEAIIGFKMGSILHPDSAEKLQKHLDKVVSSEGIFDFEEKLHIKGKDVYWQGVYTPYFGQSEDISGVVAVYRDTTKMVEEREAEQARIDQLIQVLTMSIELVNPYLRGHSKVMGELSEKLARRLGRSVDERKTLGMAASLSQMGMISLPKELLNKKGALTEEERETMKTHVTKTCEILADFDFGLPVQETIVQMHENMDGTGYPYGLEGDKINYLSRILHVANAFCAILRPRVYRQGRTLEDALGILNKESSLYDKKVLEALEEFTASEEGKTFVSALQRTNIPA